MLDECLINSHSWVAQASIAMGILRLINKPLFSFLHRFISLTPWVWDDYLEKKLQSSRYVRAFCFLLDWIFSIKLKGGR